MKAADIAMYSAKENGSNNFQFYSKEINLQLQEGNLIGEHLRFALERDELFLEYQPKLDFKPVPLPVSKRCCAGTTRF